MDDAVAPTDVLAATLRAVVAADDVVSVVAGDPGNDGGWDHLATIDVSTPGSRTPGTGTPGTSTPGAMTVIDRWFAATLANVPNGARDVAGSYLAGFAADVVTWPVGRALRRQRRGIVLDADLIWLHQHAEGWFDGVAIGGDVMVLPDDPAAGTPGTTTVADLTTLTRRTVGGLVAVLGPLFAAVRARAPYGLRGMWGAVADAIAADATWRAHVEGADVVRAWADAQPLLDALAADAPAGVTRPTFARVELDEHVAHLTIRGTCCLYYKSVEHRPAGDAEYCTSCPVGTAAQRQRRQTDWLARQRTTGAG
jgi:hypothetical protein